MGHPLDVANKLVAAIKEPTTGTALADALEKAVVASGGKENPAASRYRIRVALAAAEALGLVTITRPTDLLISSTKPAKK